jgi:hypothetical protein
MSPDRDRNARIHTSHAALGSSGRIVGYSYLGITSALPANREQLVDIRGNRRIASANLGGHS